MEKFDELPKEIQNRMLDCQVEQGNERNPDVFRRWIEEVLRGFDWNATPEEYNVWYQALVKNNYAPFFEFHGIVQENDDILKIVSKDCGGPFVGGRLPDIKTRLNFSVEVIKAVPYQVCPLCEGLGQIQNDNLNAVGTLYVDCPVCLGSRVIPMYALPNEIITEEE